jgi:hypothetical protein
MAGKHLPVKYDSTPKILRSGRDKEEMGDIFRLLA